MKKTKTKKAGKFVKLSSVNSSVMPVVFWVSEPVAAGELVLVMGCCLEGVTGVILTAPNGRKRLIKPEQASTSSIKFRLPGKPAFGTGAFRFQLKSSSGITAPFNGNTPRVDWVMGDQGDSATPGGTLRAFGRCLGWSGKQVQCQARLEGKGKPVALKITERTPYTLSCGLPDNLPAGVYSLVVADHIGKQSVTSRPVAVKVQAADPWPQTRFNVRDYGAKGDAEADDTPAVKAAIEAAGKAGGGIVFFPRGRYQLNDGLVLPKYVTLKGERRTACLLAWPDKEKNVSVAIRGSSHFVVEDLTLFFASYKYGIQNMEYWGDPSGLGNVTLRNLVIRGHRFLDFRRMTAVLDQLEKFGKGEEGGGGLTILLGGSNLVIEKCDVFSSQMPFVIGKASYVRIERNRFAGGLLSHYVMYDTQQMVFEHNTYQGSLLGNGGGIASCSFAVNMNPSGRVDTSGQTVVKNNYVAHNTYFDIFGADREAFTTDCGNTCYHGGIRNSTVDRVNLPAGSAYIKGRIPRPGTQCMIVSGRGAGQFRPVRGADKRGVTLETPWAVVPDETSTICLTAAQTNMLFLHNRIADAGIAFQIYGSGVDCVIADNVCERAGGFHVWSLDYGVYGILPALCNQLLGNKILEGTSFHHKFGGTGRRWTSHVGALTSNASARGLVIRGNALRENAYLELCGDISDVLVSGNSVSHSDIGILITGNVKNELLSGNRFFDVAEHLRDERGAQL